MRLIVDWKNSADRLVFKKDLYSLTEKAWVLDQLEMFERDFTNLDKLKHSKFLTIPLNVPAGMPPFGELKPRKNYPLRIICIEENSNLVLLDIIKGKPRGGRITGRMLRRAENRYLDYKDNN